MTAGRRHVPTTVAAAAVGFAVLAFGAVGVSRYRDLRAETAAELNPPPSPPPPVVIDPGLVVHGSRLAFTYDPPSALAALRAAEGLDAVVAGADTDEERVRRLASWTRRQFEPGVPVPYPAPEASVTLAEIRAGRTGGAAAQFCFVLVQAAQSFGLPARVVALREHFGVEAWLRDEGRWTFFDPTYECQVQDARGRTVDAVTARSMIRHGEGVSVTGGGRFEGTPIDYFDHFDDVGIWLRNAFVTAPINPADFARYCVWYEEKPGIKERPMASLRTAFRDDLYAAPPLP